MPSNTEGGKTFFFFFVLPIACFWMCHHCTNFVLLHATFGYCLTLTGQFSGPRWSQILDFFCYKFSDILLCPSRGKHLICVLEFIVGKYRIAKKSQRCYHKHSGLINDTLSRVGYDRGICDLMFVSGTKTFFGWSLLLSGDVFLIKLF